MSEGAIHDPVFVRAKGQVRQAVALLRAAGRDVDVASPAAANELAALFGEAERVAQRLARYGAPAGSAAARRGCSRR